MSASLRAAMATTAVVVGVGAMIVGGGSALASQGGNDHKVTICHCDGTDYDATSIDKAAIVKGTGHGGHRDDILPAFSYDDSGTTKYYPGQGDQSILARGCSMASTTTEPTIPTTVPRARRSPTTTEPTIPTTEPEPEEPERRSRRSPRRCPRDRGARDDGPDDPHDGARGVEDPETTVPEVEEPEVEEPETTVPRSRCPRRPSPRSPSPRSTVPEVVDPAVPAAPADRPRWRAAATPAVDRHPARDRHRHHGAGDRRLRRPHRRPGPGPAGLQPPSDRQGLTSATRVAHLSGLRRPTGPTGVPPPGTPVWSFSGAGPAARRAATIDWSRGWPVGGREEPQCLQPSSSAPSGETRARGS